MCQSHVEIEGCMNTYEVHMSPALNGSSAIRQFEGSNAVQIRDGITFNFYTGLPHMYLFVVLSNVSFNQCNSMHASHKISLYILQ